MKIRDVGFLPEDDLHLLAKDSTPYDVGHDESKYDLETVLVAAEDASSLKPGKTKSLVERLSDKNRAVRYWAALGLFMRGKSGLKAGHDELTAALKDESPSVRVIAAQVLAQFGSDADNTISLDVLLKHASLDTNSILRDAGDAVAAHRTHGERTEQAKDRCAIGAIIQRVSVRPSDSINNLHRRRWAGFRRHRRPD